MKRIYNTLFIVGFISLFMSSCNDWLDVRPSDEIKEEYLFETGNGYRTALMVFTGNWQRSICMAAI